MWKEPWGGDYLWPASDNKVYEYAVTKELLLWKHYERGAIAGTRQVSARICGRGLVKVGLWVVGMALFVLVEYDWD